MSEENKNEVIDSGEETAEESVGSTYSVVSFFSFVLLIASLVVASPTAVKCSLLWMCAVRSYGLIFKGIKAEWGCYYIIRIGVPILRDPSQSRVIACCPVCGSGWYPFFLGRWMLILRINVSIASTSKSGRLPMANSFAKST